ncbi:MAG: hypothetical protein SV487_06355, partial [Thermodesulfobacteriota bacterium]|nr:hypothetical protein [Thermodesulfobacteriota bacterium]
MTRLLFSSPLLALVLAGLLLISPASLAWAANSGTEESQRIKAAEKKERRLLGELNELEKRISLLEDRIARIEQEIASVWKRLAQGEKEITALGRRLSRLKKYLRCRLRAMYLLRGGGLLQVLLKAESIPDLAHRYRYISAVLERDRSALREYNYRQARLKAWTKQLKADRTGLYRLKVDLGAEKKKVVKARHAKTAVLMKVHQRKELYLAMLRSRAESRRRLIREVFIRPESGGRVEPDSQAKTPDRKWPDFAGLKGRIPRPAPGSITGRFGRTPGPFDT